MSAQHPPPRPRLGKLSGGSHLYFASSPSSVVSSGSDPPLAADTSSRMAENPGQGRLEQVGLEGWGGKMV